MKPYWRTWVGHYESSCKLNLQFIGFDTQPKRPWCQSLPPSPWPIFVARSVKQNSSRKEAAAAFEQVSIKNNEKSCFREQMLKFDWEIKRLRQIRFSFGRVGRVILVEKFWSTINLAAGQISCVPEARQNLRMSLYNYTIKLSVAMFFTVVKNWAAIKFLSEVNSEKRRGN